MKRPQYDPLALAQRQHPSDCPCPRHQHSSMGRFCFLVRWVRLVVGTYCCLSGISELPRLATGQSLLLVGNSYTRFNNLNAMLRSMLSEAYGTTVRVEQHAPNGETLQGHVETTQASSNLRRWLVTEPVAWTWVVLQEQSQVGGLHEFINFFFSVEAAKSLNDLIRATGGDTVFFQTWGRRDGDPAMSSIYPDFLTMNEKLRIGYQSYVRETSTAERPTFRAPVGDAFEYLFRNPDAAAISFRALYNNDGSHPSTAGTYLTACVIFATMTGMDPRQLVYLPSNFDSGTAVDLRTLAQTVVPEATAPLPNRSPATSPPTPRPTSIATQRPTGRPTQRPTARPTTPVTTESPPPTIGPTQRPTVHHTTHPTAGSTLPVTPSPTQGPTSRPVQRPTAVDAPSGPSGTTPSSTDHLGTSGSLPRRRYWATVAVSFLVVIVVSFPL